jgi:hypothetical protein
VATAPTGFSCQLDRTQLFCRPSSKLKVPPAS